MIFSSSNLVKLDLDLDPDPHSEKLPDPHKMIHSPGFRSDLIRI